MLLSDLIPVDVSALPDPLPPLKTAIILLLSSLRLLYSAAQAGD